MRNYHVKLGIKQKVEHGIQTAKGHLHIWSFLIGITVCGLIFGSIVASQINVSDAQVLNGAIERVLSAISGHQLASPEDIWWQRMISDGQILALLWLFGLSVLGVPLIVTTIFLRAFSVGFAVGYTTMAFGWKGFLVASLGIFLHQLISLTMLLIAGGFAIRFSTNILFQRTPFSNLLLPLIKYCGIFVLCTCGLMVGGAVQAYVAPHLLLWGLQGE
jgi:stage II sporulation protein M